jgi:sugar transferase (PEP-CTERM/EpsH1 system associated)
MSSESSTTATLIDRAAPTSRAAKTLPLICHVILRLDVGGLENGLVNLINNLPSDAYRHAVICVTSATDFRQRIRRPGVEIYEIRKRKGKDFAAYGRMWRLLRQLRPRIVHTRNLPALDMLLPAKLAGVLRLVHSEHGFDMIELDGKNRWYNRLRWLSRWLVDSYIAVSQDISNWLIHDVGISPARMHLIYNGVDTDRFAPATSELSVLPPGFAPPGAVVIGTIGRLEQVKDQTALARAFCLLVQREPRLRENLRLAIIGDGSLRGPIEATLAEADASDLAWLPGFRNDTAPLYRAFSIFVLPSLREGISNTALEAMASGLPIVATRVGGNPEIIPDDVVGQLVPPSDPDALAAALLHYIGDSALRREHGIAAREHVLRHYSLAAMMRNYDSIYRSLI